MAVTLAMAVGIATIDLWPDIASYRAQIAATPDKVSQLRQAVADQKRLADEREGIRPGIPMELTDRMNAILNAPDRKIVQLVAPNPAEPMTGIVSISQKMNGAVLSAHRLSSPPGVWVYKAWWILKNAPAAKAAELGKGSDGSINAYLEPPPSGSVPISLSITLEPSRDAGTPTGLLKLWGPIQDADQQTTAREINPGGSNSRAEASNKHRLSAATAFASAPPRANWYLIVPPLNRVSHELDRTASPNQWSIVDSFSTRAACGKSMTDPEGHPVYRAAACIAADDPRLKSD
jgi:hypothetical protein